MFRLTWIQLVNCNDEFIESTNVTTTNVSSTQAQLQTDYEILLNMLPDVYEAKEYFKENLTNMSYFNAKYFFHRWFSSNYTQC